MIGAMTCSRRASSAPVVRTAATYTKPAPPRLRSTDCRLIKVNRLMIDRFRPLLYKLLSKVPRSERHRVTAGWRFVLVSAAVVGTVAGCGSHAKLASVASGSALPVPASPSASAPSTLLPASVSHSAAPSASQKSPVPSVNAQQALNSLVSRFWSTFATSGIIRTGADPIAAVSYQARQSPAYPAVGIFELSPASGTWTTLATLQLPIGGEVLSASTNDTPVTAEDVTGGPLPDFAVVVSYNAGPATAIASDAGGNWHLLTFSGPSSFNAQEVMQATFPRPDVVVSISNSCQPDCASGQQVSTTYQYESSTGELVAQAG